MLKPGEATLLILRRTESEAEQYEVLVRHFEASRAADALSLDSKQVAVKELREINDLGVALEYGVRALRSDAAGPPTPGS